MPIKQQQSISTINISQSIPATEAEGPGLRYAIWVQGCSLRCVGCCNPHMFTSTAKNEKKIDDIIEDIKNSLLQNPTLEGISILGGEPVEQPDALYELVKKVQSLNLSVMVFTGTYYDDIQKDPKTNRFLEYCDILIDGPFEQNNPEHEGFNRKWIGSQNQNIYILSQRYLHLQGKNWPQDKNTVEIRMYNGEITINGFPFDNFMQIRKRS